MVFEAVVGLKEPYGSSNASIASYIEVRWYLLAEWIYASLVPYSVRCGVISMWGFRSVAEGTCISDGLVTLWEGRTCDRSACAPAHG